MANKIKSITRYHRPLDAPDAELESDDFSAVITHYTELDERSNVTSEITYSVDGHVETRSERHYDPDGRLSGEKLYDGEDELTEDHVYTYREGRLTGESITYLDGSCDTIEYQYDALGNQVLVVRINDEGEEEERKERTYAGKLMLTEELRENGELVGTTVNKYSGDGQLLSSATQHRDDPVIELRFDYDENGYQVKASRFLNQRLVEVTEYERDDAGTVSAIRERDAYRDVGVAMKYDDSGRVVEQVEKNAEGEEVGIIHRQYDEDGNLLISEVYVAGDGRHAGEHYQVIYEYEFY
jgi:antitoxin component YwqK of YwqJK toxin-antitoxin module